MGIGKKDEPTEVKLGSVNSADGAVLIQYDGEELVAGVPVFVVDEATGERVSIPDGEIELEGGMILVVSGGVAMEIKEAIAAGSDPNAEPVGIPSDADTLAEVQNIIKSIMIKYHEEVDLKFKNIELKFETIKKENTDLKNEVLELSKQPAAKPIKSQPTQVDLSKMTNYQRLKYNEEKGIR